MNKTKIKSIIVSIVLVSSLFIVSGCNLLENEYKQLQEHFKGRNAIITTYDKESKPLDRIEGKSISISLDDKFKEQDEKGETIKKSSVLNITVGNNQIIHVGSSLILQEDGLQDLMKDTLKTTEIINQDKSRPFLRNIVDSYKNITSGKKRVILIRSQDGKPLATFVGDNVSYFATDIPKSTGILIDGKYLLIYRCDYTIYDMDLIR
ncbi:DUF5052 family protein [Clostridium botulinum]|uniref:DUF5052 family protein n=4 Tax=Clostridium TaxID=1485 RepID=A0A6M0T066_CLOBO|nr:MULTISPECIES: DUF5052 family protein [Clostridium]EKX78775.1 ATPase [Clostridium botulinum CFSAN001628]ACA47071.1 ATPase [Clostridium botulinum B1 str. Okra]APF25154.1 putative glycerol dehydrogenase [Clostridium sporogenes]APH13534.1 putative glycerol dehydrogenase [Clostridium sporogenes]AUM93815.1 DUF5052 domain-containing protein [Clostridium sporogenes]